MRDVERYCQELPIFVLLKGMVVCGFVSKGPGKAVVEVL